MRTDGKYSPEDYETAFVVVNCRIKRRLIGRKREFISSNQINKRTRDREVIDALVDLIEKVDDPQYIGYERFG